MVQLFDCFKCHKIAPLKDGTDAKCSLCGSPNGEKVSRERLEKGLASGAYYDIDPRTGKRAKARRRPSRS